MSGASPNDSPKSGVPSPWSQIVVAAAPPSSPSPPPFVVAGSSVVNSAPAESSDNAAVGHNVNSVRWPAWNKPSNVASSLVMGADSWPPLAESARAPARSPPESVNISVGVPSLLQLQGTPNMLHTPHRPVRDTASMNNMIPAHIHPRPFRHANSNGGHPSQLPPPQGPMVPPVSHNYNKDDQPRPGFGPNDHPQQQNSSRNRNAGPHQRGDGAHHHNYGNRREQDRGNQDWNTHHHNYGNKRHEDRGNQDWTTQQNFNTTPRFAPPFIRPPLPPNPSQLFSPSPPPLMSPMSPMSPFVGSIGYTELPPQLVYPPPPLESPRVIRFVPPVPPNAMYVQPPEQPLTPEHHLAPELLHVEILKQIDYYFSIDNLVTDDFLRAKMDDQGWVSIYLVAGFQKVQNMTKDIQTILNAVQSSTVVEVQGEKIRKRNDWKTWIIPNDKAPQTVGRVAERVQSIAL